MNIEIKKINVKTINKTLFKIIIFQKMNKNYDSTSTDVMSFRITISSTLLISLYNVTVCQTEFCLWLIDSVSISLFVIDTQVTSNVKIPACQRSGLLSNNEGQAYCEETDDAMRS